MTRTLEIISESWPIAGKFTISRGSKTSAEIIVCKLFENGVTGFGECVPYARYGETQDSVRDQLEAVREPVEAGEDLRAICNALPAGAARNALDCAIWDLQAKLSSTPVERSVCNTLVRPIVTAVTISLGTVDEMATAARGYAQRDLIKVKLGSDDDVTRIHAVASGAPNSRIILDANEGWTPQNIQRHLRAASEHRIALIEQPLPTDNDAILRDIPHPVPICADESVHVAADLPKLKGLYDAVNIKLDKTGGLSEALTMRDRAHELGFSVMVGCMVGTSLAMAPAVYLAQTAEYVDLDGPLLLARDRPNGLYYSSSTVSPPSRELWG